MKRFTILSIVCTLLFTGVQAMDNNALARSNSDADQDPMRNSRASLTPAGREDNKLQRSSTEILCINAKKIATEARKKRANIIDSSRKQLDTKIQLLTAQKQIERQIELLKTVTAENKEAAKEQLRTYMTEAYIVIQAANTPQEDIDLTNATLASIQTAQEENLSIPKDLEAQVSDTGNSNSNNNSNNNKSSAVAKKSTHSSDDNEDVNTVIAQIDEFLARVDTLQRSRIAPMPLSPRAEKIQVIMEEVEQKSQKRPDISYEILLEHIQTHKELFLNKMHQENNAGLQVGLQRITGHNRHPLDYILFAVMLECGVNRTLAYNGRTLLDAAMDSGNEVLVQLLTTEHPTKQTLIDLAYEHHQDDLIPFLLSEEECIARACQGFECESISNNNNN